VVSRPSYADPTVTLPVTQTRFENARTAAASNETRSANVHVNYARKKLDVECRQ